MNKDIEKLVELTEEEEAGIRLMYLENPDYDTYEQAQELYDVAKESLIKQKRMALEDTIEFEPIADESLDATFTIVSEDGKETKCEILFTYHDDERNKDYIAYTDNTLDDEGNTKVFASIYNPDEDNPDLLPIETDEEWEIIEKALDAIINDIDK